MEYEDRVSIATPEGVDVELRLAGLGSRFTATLVDWVIIAAILTALGIVLGGFGAVSESIDSGLGAALWTTLAFLVIAGYDTAFETLASGRTPGKRVNGLRVVRDDGSPITFTAAAIRNILRLIDIQPGTYLVGAASILLSSRNQRLGDIVAGTLVVRERRERRPRGAPVRRARPEAVAHWDVSAVTAEELATVRQFLERRDDLTPESRRELAVTLAERLRPKVVGAPSDLYVESFLEDLAAAKAART